MRALVVAIAVMVSGAAVAIEMFPVIDVERNCELPGGVKATKQSYNYCIDREQKSYDLAKRVFPDIDESVKLRCREDIKKYNQGYHSLYGCYYAQQTILDDARNRELERQAPARRFKY